MNSLFREKERILRIRTKYSHESEEGISIVCCTNKLNYFNNILNNYNSQSYKKKELILVLNSSKYNLNYIRKEVSLNKDIRVIQLNENMGIGECLNTAIQMARYDFIAKMDDDDYYAKNYVIDSMNNFKYVKADIIGKLSYFVYFEEFKELGVFSPNNENRYTNIVAGSTIIFKKNLFKKVRFKDLPEIGEDTQFINDCLRENFIIYSADKFNYVYMKHRNLSEHTWKIDSNYYKLSCEIIRKTHDFKSITSI